MADRKITELTAITAVAEDDQLAIVDTNEQETKKATLAQLLRGVPNGSAVLPSIAFGTDPDSGLFRDGINLLGIATGGSRVARFGTTAITTYVPIDTAGGNLQFAPSTTDVEVLGGGGTSGGIQLNCEQNSHSATIKGPPHTGAVTYEMQLPPTIGTSGQVLTTDGAGVLSWTTPLTAGETGARKTVSVTTASIADGAPDNVTLTGTTKAGYFLAVTTDRAAWITFYATQASRTGDSGRAETADPAPGSGVLLEVVTNTAQTVLITPVTGYFNNETVVATELYLKVVNKSGATSTVTVDVKLIPLEA